MQRISHPWPLSCISTGFCVMYRLASICAWWCINCPSGVGPDCHFYHFILSRINKLVYWARQHRKFILFSLACTVISFPTHRDALAGVAAAPTEPQTTASLLSTRSLTSLNGRCSTSPKVYPCKRWRFGLNQTAVLKAEFLLCGDVFIGPFYLCFCHAACISRGYKNLLIFVIITCTCWC